MIQQQLKDAYFFANRFVSLPNHLAARLRFRSPQYEEGHYIHLGCGDDYIPGMINVDGNLLRKKNLWLDLRNALPFKSDSVFFIYCSHTLEHLYPSEALRLLREMRRVLRSNGLARVAVPSFEHCMRIANAAACSNWPRQFEDSWSQAVNYLFCDGQHKYGYTYEIISRFAKEAGFRSVFHYSAEHGVAKKQYGCMTVGGEPAGSLVVELAP